MLELGYWGKVRKIMWGTIKRDYSLIENPLPSSSWPKNYSLTRAAQVQAATSSVAAVWAWDSPQ